MKADDTDPFAQNVLLRLRMLEANGGEVLSRLRRIETDVATAVAAAERQLFSISELVSGLTPDAPTLAPNGQDDVPTSEERGR